MSLLATETDFGLSLLNQAPLTESAVLSPLSVFLALSLVHAGAKGNTRDEIRNSFAKSKSVLVKKLTERLFFDRAKGRY